MDDDDGIHFIEGIEGTVVWTLELADSAMVLWEEGGGVVSSLLGGPWAIGPEDLTPGREIPT